MAYHYVYRLTCGPFFYIGMRTSAVEPAHDDYWGSGFVCRSGFMDRRRSKEVKKEILAVFETRGEAAHMEALLINKNIKSTFCKNLRCPRLSTRRESA